jgi:hypothetical protein
MEKTTWVCCSSGVSSSVCMLKKAMYGLEQSPRFEKFSEVVLQFGLQRCQTNNSIFHLHAGASYIRLVVYVDDIVITGNYSKGIAQLK